MVLITANTIRHISSRLCVVVRARIVGDLETRLGVSHAQVVGVTSPHTLYLNISLTVMSCDFVDAMTGTYSRGGEQ